MFRVGDATVTRIEDPRIFSRITWRRRLVGANPPIRNEPVISSCDRVKGERHAVQFKLFIGTQIDRGVGLARADADIAQSLSPFRDLPGNVACGSTAADPFSLRTDLCLLLSKSDQNGASLRTQRCANKRHRGCDPKKGEDRQLRRLL